MKSRRIFHCLKKRTHFKYWTNQEDELLLKIAQENNCQNWKDWKDFSHLIPNRDHIQCYARYARIRPGLVKGAWTKEEDEKLTSLVEAHGTSWVELEQHFSSRTAKQIRDRYINSLDPSIKKEKFTKEEDNKIEELYEKFGPKWSKIASFIEHRPPDLIKNRYNSKIQKLSNAAERERNQIAMQMYYDKSNSTDLIQRKRKSPIAESSSLPSGKNQSCELSPNRTTPILETPSTQILTTLEEREKYAQKKDYNSMSSLNNLRSKGCFYGWYCNRPVYSFDCKKYGLIHMNNISKDVNLNISIIIDRITALREEFLKVNTQLEQMNKYIEVIKSHKLK